MWLKKIKPKVLILSLSLIGLVILSGIFLIFSTNYKNNEVRDFIDITKLSQEVAQGIVNYVHLPENKNVEPSVRILFLGDLMLDRYVAQKIKEQGIYYLFSELEKRDFFDNYNLVAANLEGAVTNNGVHYPPAIGNDFTFNPEIIKELRNYNFSFFNLANNHLTDQGEQGIVETRDNLDELGFYYSGCRDGRVDECSVKIVEIKNKKVALVGLSMVYSRFDLEQAENLIKDLADTADLVIVNIHWGEEYKTQFSLYQQEIGRGLIDAGADLIIGHHPHVVQGVEIYKNKPIFYSLGNFVFDQYFSVETQKGLAVELLLEKSKLHFNLHPYKSQNSQISLMADQARGEFLQQMIEHSVIDKEFSKSILNGTFELVLE